MFYRQTIHLCCAQAWHVLCTAMRAARSNHVALYLVAGPAVLLAAAMPEPASMHRGYAFVFEMAAKAVGIAFTVAGSLAVAGHLRLRGSRTAAALGMGGVTGAAALTVIQTGFVLVAIMGALWQVFAEAAFQQELAGTAGVSLDAGPVVWSVIASMTSIIEPLSTLRAALLALAASAFGAAAYRYALARVMGYARNLRQQSAWQHRDASVTAPCISEIRTYARRL